MNKRLVLICTVLTITTILITLSIPFADSYIPPTRAFFRIFSGTGNVTAQSSMGDVTFIAGSNMTITPNYSTNEITFSSTNNGGGSGSGENNTASNFGTYGTGIFKDKSGVDLRFLKALSANSNLIITSNSSNIIYNATGSGSDTTIPVDVSSQRAFGTVYQNLSGQPLFVIITIDAISGMIGQDASAYLTADELEENLGNIGLGEVTTQALASHHLQGNIVAKIPNNWYYKLVNDSGGGVAAINNWVEYQ